MYTDRPCQTRHHTAVQLHVARQSAVAHAFSATLIDRWNVGLRIWLALRKATKQSFTSGLVVTISDHQWQVRDAETTYSMNAH